VIGVLLIGVLCLAAPASAQQRPPIADQIAKTYGFDSWGQVEAIRYTFSIDAGPALKVTRSWVWEPKTDRITYDGPDKAGKPVKVTYLRSQLATQDAFVKEQVDPAFPERSVLARVPVPPRLGFGATIEDAGMQKLPVGKGSARKVVVKYPSGGGYTPGTPGSSYVGKDGRIQFLVFHHGGTAKPSLVTATWADYKKAGPLLFSLDHRGKADGKPLRLFYSKVAVKLVGSSTWMEAR
jgi:hypothetical protein